MFDAQYTRTKEAVGLNASIAVAVQTFLVVYRYLPGPEIESVVGWFGQFLLASSHISCPILVNEFLHSLSNLVHFVDIVAAVNLDSRRKTG